MFILKELRNCIPRIIRVWSLFCSMPVYRSLHFLLIFLETFFFVLRCFLCFFACSVCWIRCKLYKHFKHIRNVLASKKVIPQSMPLLSWLTKFINHLKTTTTQLDFLLIYLRPLTMVLWLSKAFDHVILLEKLENYAVTGTNLWWFRSYLTNRKKYIQITNGSKTDLQNTTCGVPKTFCHSKWRINLCKWCIPCK